MAEIVLPTKPLAVNPLKACQPIGASLAFLGLADAMPLEHGARGCTSFNKLFFMRHFREPIALQTTAMDQATAVLGADSNVVEALATICEKDKPKVIGLITTGLSETQGADIPRTIKAFREEFPQHEAVAIVPASASDTLGCLETGFALAVEAIIAALAPRAPSKLRRPRQVNVLASAMLAPGDVEAIKDWIAAFGLTAIVLPDIADSLDGHMIEAGFSTLTYGGTPPADIARMGESVATLVIGRSLDRAADLLDAKTGVPDYRFASLIGPRRLRRLLQDLELYRGRAHPGQDRAPARAIAGRHGRLPVPARRRARRHRRRCGPACRNHAFFVSMGAEVVAAVASSRADHLSELPIDSVVIGDLEDLEWLSREHGAELIVANSHGAEIAKRLKTALFRAGFPIYDSYGAHARALVGYAGSRQTLFDLANLLAGQYREIEPYRSRYWQGTERDAETGRDAAC